VVALVVVVGVVAVAIAASGGGSSTPASSAGSSTTTTPSPGRTYDLSLPVSQQSCAARLGKSAGKLPLSLPTLPGATFDGIDKASGLFAGHLPGTQTAVPIAQLRTAFTKNGYKTTNVVSQGTVSKFAFKHHKVEGLAFVAVLCKGNLRIEYQLVLPPVSTASPPPVSTASPGFVRPTTTPGATSP
jgi:hypothetical protein